MSKQKTTLTPEVIKAFLRDHCMDEVNALQQMVEGEESQAFSFKCEGEEFVVRINSSIDGFLKNAHAEAHLSSMSHYRERIRCYQLRIGLAEVYDTALLHRWDTMQWTLKRSVEVARALH